MSALDKLPTTGGFFNNKKKRNDIIINIIFHFIVNPEKTKFCILQSAMETVLKSPLHMPANFNKAVSFRQYPM